MSTEHPPGSPSTAESKTAGRGQHIELTVIPQEEPREQTAPSISDSPAQESPTTSTARSGENDKEIRMLDLVSYLLGSHNSKMRLPEARMLATSSWPMTFSPGIAPGLIGHQTPGTTARSTTSSGGNGREWTWERIGILAETRLSTIFLCNHLHYGTTFVAKTVLAHDLEARTAIEMERRMYNGNDPIKSPYFLRYLGFNIEKNCKEMNNNEVCNLFLERITLGSLYQFIHKRREALDESLICAFSRDILLGLEFLHRRGKIHGDIKASNVLIGCDCLKLCDLGSGKIIADGDVHIPPKKGSNPLAKCIFTTGSDGFKAPEVEEETEQGPAADIYAFGCTLVEMATGNPPQRCPRIYASDILTEPLAGYPCCSIDLPAIFSKEAFDLLESCLAEDPKDRPSAQVLLQHAWFKKFPSFYAVPTLVSEPGLISVKSAPPPSTRLPALGS